MLVGTIVNKDHLCIEQQQHDGLRILPIYEKLNVLFEILLGKINCHSMLAFSLMPKCLLYLDTSNINISYYKV